MMLRFTENELRNLLDYTNEFENNTCSKRFLDEAVKVENKIRKLLNRGLVKHNGIEFRLQDMVK